jgi:plasmid maintenance system antidote protein VapI
MNDTPRPTMSEVIRRAIVEGGATYAELERATGLKRASIMRFVTGQRSLRLDLADRLAEHFGLTLQASKPTRRRGR